MTAAVNAGTGSSGDAGVGELSSDQALVEKQAKASSVDAHTIKGVRRREVEEKNDGFMKTV